MRNLKISLCQHPTTVVFVDDDQTFLKQLSARFIDKLPFLAFDNPRSALTYLNESYPEKPFTRRCIVNQEDAQADHFVAEVNLRAIHNEVSFTNRFAEISVVVLDYAMPAMTGIDLRKQIKNPNMLFILLTGNQDNDRGLQEFNQKTINKFILKTTQELTGKLTQYIHDLEKEYFLTLSNTILNQANPNSLLCLEDQAVADIFNQICNENHIIEYYIINDTGSFIMYDKQGKASWFALLEEQELLGFYEYAKGEQAPEDIIAALHDKTKIPLFYTEADMKTPPNQWEPYLYPATALQGNTTYYYAYIKELNSTSIEKTISSYQEYLDKL